MWRNALRRNLAKKRGRTLTIMAIPTGDESVKSFSIPLLWVYVGAAIVFCVGAFLLSSYLGMAGSVARSYKENLSKDACIEQLSKDNAVLSNINKENEKRLQEISEQLVQLETDLAYLDSLSGEITAIVKGKKVPTASTSIPSRGDYERGAALSYQRAAWDASLGQ